MRFGSKFLFGPLRDTGDGNADGGGNGDKGADDKPVTMTALAALLAENTAKLNADWQKKLDDQRKADEKARKAEEQKRAQEEADRKKAEEAERQRKDEEQRAASGGNDTKLTYELDKVKRTLEEERKKREEAEAKTAEKDAQMREKDRISAIKTALRAYEFAKPNNLEIAFRSVKDDIKFDDEGNLIDGKGIPLQDSLNDQFRTGGDLEGLLAPKASGGSGATGGGKGAGSGAIDIDSIKPGANNEAARRQIAQMAAEMMRGKTS